MSRDLSLGGLSAALILLVCSATSTFAAPQAAATTSDPADVPVAQKTIEPTESLPVTEADRIARLQVTIAADEKALAELGSQLEKKRGEEESSGAEFQKLVEQIAPLTQQFQEAQDDGDKETVQQIQEKLEPLQKERDLIKEQFDLAIQARKTLQEQTTTLETKIAQDKQALDRLKGVESAPVETPAEQPSTPATPTPATPTAPSPVGVDSAQQAEGAQAVKAEPTPESKAEKEARKEVERKEKALEELEQDLDKLSESKSLLERNIELESQTLDTARKQYDNLEEELETAESNFNERLNANAPPQELQDLRKRVAETRQQLKDSRTAIRGSTDRLQGLRSQLLALQNEETSLVKQTEELQRQAEAAKRSELYIRARQYIVTTVPQLLAILLVMIVLWAIVKLACARAKRWIDKDATGSRTERKHRSETLIGVFQNTGNAVIVVGGILMALDAARVPIAPLLGGAGVVGLAIAFAAQNLIKDYFCGFILLLENQFKLGDVVTINGMSGNVERVTLRLTVLRNLDGHVFFIPNGQITAVKNSTAGWARAVIDIGVAYKESIDRVIRVLIEIAQELRTDDEFSPFILDDAEIFGVDALGDSSVVVKLGLKVQPDKQWTIKRELLRRIKTRFDELGIEIPFPQQTVHHRVEEGNPMSFLAETSAPHDQR